MESFTDTVLENFTGTVLKTLHKFKYSRIQIFLFIIPFCKLNESWYQICAWILSIKQRFLKKVSYRVCQKSIAQKIWKYVQSNFIKITLRHECSPVNLLHIFRAYFPRSTSVSSMGGFVFYGFFYFSGVIVKIIKLTYNHNYRHFHFHKILIPQFLGYSLSSL